MPQPEAQPAASGAGPRHRVRQLVAAHTRGTHEALHLHPVLGRLTSASISAEVYDRILCAYLGFFLAAEGLRARLGLLPAAALAREIAALRDDVGDGAAVPGPSLPITTPPEALGMLYVLHGSRFGGRIILRSLALALPGRRHAFFGLGSDVAQWQAVLAAMEACGNDPAKVAAITRGASVTFDALGQWMTDRAGEVAAARVI